MTHFNSRFAAAATLAILGSALVPYPGEPSPYSKYGPAEPPKPSKEKTPVVPKVLTAAERKQRAKLLKKRAK